jgi:hypothetical protein
MHKDGEENKNEIKGYQNYLPISYDKCACGTLVHPLAYDKHIARSLWFLHIVHNNWRL